MFRGIQLEKLAKARESVRAALSLVADGPVHDALAASLEQFNELLGESSPSTPEKYSGSILYTVDDENDSPHRQQFELRVFYHWIDYDPLDEPYPLWGPTIETIDVVAVRQFDAEGNEISLGEHCLKVAWDLVQAEYERVVEACKRAGVVEGIGSAPSWYNPSRGVAPQLSVVTRMAPSASTRPDAQQRRQHG
jgi:hypothetical protein